MNTTDILKRQSGAPDSPEFARTGAQLLFPIHTLQHLDRDEITRCQHFLRHGDTFGVWFSPRGWVQSNSLTRIDLRQRILSFLPDEIRSFFHAAESNRVQGGRVEPILDILDEAVLWITRYALLCRMGPAGMKRSKGRSLDVSTMTIGLYTHLPRLLSLAVQRRLKLPRAETIGHGLLSGVRSSDLDTLTKNSRIKLDIEFKRLQMLQDLGLWHDAPTKPAFKGRTTGVKGAGNLRPVKDKSRKFQPLPDDYVAEMGPRVLWVIQDLGPNLIDLFEAIPEIFAGGQISLQSTYGVTTRQKRLAEYFTKNSWRDRKGEVIEALPFSLRLSTVGLQRRKNYTSDEAYAWPPKNWAQVQGLAATLQYAHLWVALMTMAGRHGEMLSLQRDCVEFVRDGTPYANGKTYKLSRRLDGEEREWVLPDVAVDVLAQQVKLVQAWEQIIRLEGGKDNGDELDLEFGSNHLWASLGNGKADPEKALDGIGGNLLRLADTLGMTPKPGGINLHPHRFRKTVARLAGIALVGSPRILMQVFGHKDIQMTLYYIMTDKALATEIETVARELRVMRCEEVIRDIRAAQGGDLPNGGYGGPGAKSIANAIQSHEQELHRTGKEWGADTTLELALILTMNGQSWVHVRPNVLCTKGIGEAGECSKRLGSPEPSSCQASCTHRIEEKTARRDVKTIIPILVADYKTARHDNQLMVMAEIGEQIRQNIQRFEDIHAQWQTDPVVAEVLAEMA